MLISKILPFKIIVLQKRFSKLKKIKMVRFGFCIGKKGKVQPELTPSKQAAAGTPKVKRKRKRLIRFPWERNEKQQLQEIKAKYIAEKNDPNKKVKRLRVKFPERHKPVTIGPGYPGIGLVYANQAIARGERERLVLKRSESGTPLLFEPLKTDLPNPVPDQVFEQFCERLGIDKYEKEDPEDPNNAIDLKAFDLYWEDIRIERNIIVKELKHLPLVAPVQLSHLSVLAKSIYNISRSCYYSPFCSHKKSEDVVHLLVWFLNRRNIPIAFHIKLLQAMSLIIYFSTIFKKELVRCGGVRVLYRSMQIGLIACGLQASWACYTLAMAAFGSPEVIHELQHIADFDETVGEMTFSMYWYYWPTNFANVLQALVFGPGGVANAMDAFEFL